jgi:hypothetical protein
MLMLAADVNTMSYASCLMKDVCGVVAQICTTVCHIITKSWRVGLKDLNLASQRNTHDAHAAARKGNP